MIIPPRVKSVWFNSTWYCLTIIASISLVSLAGYGLIQQQKKFLLKDKREEISTIADLKTAQLVQWRKERFAEGASIRANAMMSRRISDYIAGREKDAVLTEINLWMANLIDLGGYSKGILFNPAGEIIVSHPRLTAPPSRHYLDNVAEASQNQELILSDFHSDHVADPYDIDITIPIVQHEGSNYRCIAVLVLGIDPAKRLFPLIQSWPTTSPSAETLLVMRGGDSVYFLNDLRHRKKSSIPFQLPLTDRRMPAVRAALGQEGNFEGVDYRNIEVLSSIRIIPGTQWGMVAKIDKSEVLSPLTMSIWMVAFAGVVVVITMILGVFLIGVIRKTENLRKMFIIEQKHNLELKKSEETLEHQIAERTRDLSEINSILRQEIIEREKLEQQLLSAKRLEAIGQIAGGVAHEVRNPLNAILTITEALFREKEIEGNPEYEPFVHHIRTQVNRLVQLMNDLLDLGRTIPATSLQPVPLYDLCRESLDLWKSAGLSRNKHAHLSSDSDDLSIRVSADPLKLQQVFFNLLENAGHHTPDCSTIMVRLSNTCHDMQGGTAAVQIIDQGSGIAEDKLPHVFDPFFTDRKGGTGLGLALVRHFIENMGGTVHIRNNSPPPGCTAEVRIPLYREEPK